MYEDMAKELQLKLERELEEIGSFLQLLQVLSNEDLDLSLRSEAFCLARRGRIEEAWALIQL